MFNAEAARKRYKKALNKEIKQTINTLIKIIKRKTDCFQTHYTYQVSYPSQTLEEDLKIIVLEVANYFITKGFNVKWSIDYGRNYPIVTIKISWTVIKED